MRFGVYCANFGALGEARILIDLALEAEQAGWDGFFLYDHVLLRSGRAIRSVDPWTVLAVVAERTELQFGPMITPLARRRPWEVAHQTIALNRLSGGRFVLGVGLGEALDHEAFGDLDSPPIRGDRLDECLGVLQRLWAGESVTHDGSWRLEEVVLAPRPLEGKPIPIWVAARYGSRRPVRRAARFQGFFPINSAWDLEHLIEPAQVREMVAVVAAERGGLERFDVVTAGMSDPNFAHESSIEAFASAGVTWWLEIVEPRRGSLQQLRTRIAAGPPRALT
jgi:alkanesulfonate monooxygenase SsuD/methylene tetrahydromethanopterin reductase-like flavin-dependent oxidoreductase (luciferase family)